MLKVFQCSNGTVYATSNKNEVTVDEVIDFLEQHRGKLFWNGASGETSFCADINMVRTDTLEFWLTTEIADTCYSEFILDFFGGSKLYGDDSAYKPT